MGGTLRPPPALIRQRGVPSALYRVVYLAMGSIALARGVVATGLRLAVDLGKGEQHGESYRAVNPRCVAPALVTEDGAAIGEVLSIWRRTEETHPNPPLLGATPLEKALVTMWERRAELEGLAAVMGASATPPPARSAMSKSPRWSNTTSSGGQFLRRLRRSPGGLAVRRRRTLFGGRHHDAGDRRLCRPGVRHVDPRGTTVAQAVARGRLRAPERNGVGRDARRDIREKSGLRRRGLASPPGGRARGRS